MHELSIVLSIVDSVQEEITKRKAIGVKRIELDIGELSGIEWHSFDFAWGPGVKGSILEKSERIVNRIEALARCIDCHHEFEKREMYEACPKCGSFIHELKKGKELKIKSLLIIEN